MGVGHHHQPIDRSAADAALLVRRSAGVVPPLVALGLADLFLASCTLAVAHLAGVRFDGVVAVALPVLWLVLLVGVRAYESPHVQLGWWVPETFFEALPLTLLGALALLVSLHLHNALGWIWARLAERLLGSENAPAPAGGATPALPEPGIA